MVQSNADANDFNQLADLKEKQPWLDEYDKIKKRANLASWWSKDAKQSHAKELEEVIEFYQEVNTTFHLAADQIIGANFVDSQTGQITNELNRSLKEKTFVQQKGAITQLFDDWAKEGGGSEIVNGLMQWIDNFYPPAEKFSVGEYFGPFDVSTKEGIDKWVGVFQDEGQRRAAIVTESERTLIAVNLDRVSEDFFTKSPDEKMLAQLRKEVEQIKTQQKEVEARIKRRAEFFKENLPRLFGKYEDYLVKRGELVPGARARLLAQAQELAIQKTEELFAEAEKKRGLAGVVAGIREPLVKIRDKVREKISPSLSVAESARRFQPNREKLAGQKPNFREDPIGTLGRFFSLLAKRALGKTEKTSEKESQTEPPLIETARTTVLPVINRVPRGIMNALRDFISRGQIFIRERLLVIRDFVTNFTQRVRFGLVGISGLFGPGLVNMASNLVSRIEIFAKRLVDKFFVDRITTTTTIIFTFFGFIGGGLPGAIGGGMVGRIFGGLVNSPDGSPSNKRSSKSWIGGLFTFVKTTKTILTVFAAPIIIIVLLVLILAVGALFYISSNSTASYQGQTKVVSFKVEVTTLENKIANLENDNSIREITYDVKIIPSEGLVSLSDLIVKTKVSSIGKTTSQTISEAQDLIGSITFSDFGTKRYSFLVKGTSLNNSLLSIAVTVAGRTGEAEPKEEVSGVVIQIGRVQAIQPFGFPAKGVITSIDSGVGFTGKVHCGTFLPSRSCVAGGLDIAAPGGTEVFSTVTGTVEKAEFDRGDCTKGMANDGSGLCKDALGGVVYVRSSNNAYLISYVHLAENGLTTAKTVEPGDKIGIIHTGKLPTTASLRGTPEHVHYQVLFGEINQTFNKLVGKCTDGKLIPLELHLYDEIDKGPFVCE